MPERIQPILCYVTDRRGFAGSESACLEAVLRTVHSVVAAGVDWVQIREKELATQPLLDLVQRAVEAARGRATRIVVNDRLDVALAAAAAGIHLGSESMPIADVVPWCRRHGLIVGGPDFGHAQRNKEKKGALAPEEKFLVGASCHSLAEVQAAEREGATYVFFGPVFATPAKSQYGPPQGIERLAEVCHTVRLPVLAIGGITLENAAECIRSGAAGIAAIRLFQESADLATVTGKLRADL